LKLLEMGIRRIESLKKCVKIRKLKHAARQRCVEAFGRGLGIKDFYPKNIMETVHYHKIPIEKIPGLLLPIGTPNPPKVKRKYVRRNTVNLMVQNPAPQNPRVVSESVSLLEQYVKETERRLGLMRQMLALAKQL